MTFSGAVFLILFSIFIYCGYLAGFWAVMNTWNWQTWTIFAGGVMFTWIARNEFGGRS